ncbi:PEPxxWA-CTERM sorting domain-containing protein [Sandaracinobacteroides saxicola]|uniref:PEPxxWA-CTERM sorting domain-containing protein n=1 Tax=Sandaracinobacteroides saxicola TaxID=2759707 RepID=UPI001FB195B1|nr:PEPxxWA-CTERM sorting domain-containing protein [Sandaracinobacteroides saxicola]
MRFMLFAALLAAAPAAALTTVVDFDRSARDPAFPAFVRDGFGGTAQVDTRFESFSTGFPATGSRIVGLRYQDIGHGDLAGYARDDQSFLQFRLLRLDPTVTLTIDSFRIASSRADFMFTTEVRVFSDANDLLWSSGVITPPATGHLLVSPGVSFAGGLTVNLYSRTVFGIDQIRYTTAPTVAPIPEPGTWALMIAGFGLVGSTLRRRRRSLMPR